MSHDGERKESVSIIVRNRAAQSELIVESLWLLSRERKREREKERKRERERERERERLSMGDMRPLAELGESVGNVVGICAPMLMGD
jgi:hypothetical protein